MPDFETLEPLNLPRAFQIAWESTLKCNMDCSYCGNGHDNSKPHPSLEDCLNTVDFIIEYVNLYMSTRSQNNKVANLNIHGGESIFQPEIVEILEYARSQKEKYNDWQLNVSLITNATTSMTRWKKIVELVDYFTISFHAEGLEKQHQQFKENVLYLKQSNKNFQVSVLMHPKYWNVCVDMIEWCKEHEIQYLPRQIDHSWIKFQFNYSAEQVEYLTGMPKISTASKILSIFKSGINLSAKGRACCGGDTLCTKGINGTNETKYVQGNNFKGWHCSVNRSFLYIRQTTGEVYTNKDCRMNLDGKIGVLGYLKDSKKILSDLKQKIETDTLPDIICKKNSCWCGLCAPKAETKEKYDQIMNRF